MQRWRDELEDISEVEEQESVATDGPRRSKEKERKKLDKPV